MWCGHKVKVFEKKSCEVYLSLHPVGYSGSQSTVNETNCNCIQNCPTTMCLKMNTIVSVDLDGDALQLALLIRGKDVLDNWISGIASCDSR